MNIIIFGPPGAGKGTQSNYISREFALKQISTGKLLREEVKNKTELGKKIEILLNKGEFVPDKIVNQLVEKIISNNNNFNQIILDGYPRNLLQVEVLNNLLETFKQKISLALNLNIEKDSLLKRITGRITCIKCSMIFNEYFDPPSLEKHKCGEKFLKKRTDDNETTIINRFEAYLIKTKPVLEYYKKNGSLYEIDGNLTIDEIYSNIQAILKNLRD